jgi:toxin ParE1/3/4
MIVRWTPTGLRDLECLHAYVAEDNAEAAAITVERILTAIEELRRHPEMGRRGRVTGTRELVVPPYIIAYRAKGTALQILGVIHGTRRWPDSF